MKRPLVGIMLLAASAGMGLADDIQDCLSSDADPIEGLAACTRIITAPSQNPQQIGNAYYHRGLAFMELEEWEHARIDFERSIEHDPNGEAAAKMLRELEEDGRVVPRNR